MSGKKISLMKFVSLTTFILLVTFGLVSTASAVTSITVVSPDGGEDWAINTAHNITWSSGSLGKYVKLELLKNRVLNRVITPRTPNDGSYNWTIGSTQTLGTDYKIRVKSTTKSAYADTSNNNFRISSSIPSITIVSPNGGENWERGTIKTISWASSDSPGTNVKIELLKGEATSIINSSTLNDGSYSWAIPSTQTLGTDYRVRITNINNPDYTDTSNNNFTISPSTPKPTVYAGWRSSAYGYQIASPPSYWVNVAKAMASKFPDSTPGGIWLVGETDGDPATGTLLYMPSTGSYPDIRFQGGDIAEPYLAAFDAAGVKVILQVEPMNANINTLIDIVMNRYKDHPSVIGFGVDNEWYKTCADGCKATSAEVISWNNKLHSINPNYILMIKHFDEAKLPTGIPADILVICDDEQNGNLATLVSEHVAMENQYPNNPYGAQIGYPSDNRIWGSMSDPAKQVGSAVQTAIGRPISVFWVDFSITTLFPPLQYNGG